MLIKENKELPETVLGVLRKRVFFRGKWHLTDLLCCPRITYWLVTGEKPHYTNGKLLTFSRGGAHHEILEVFPLKEIYREKDGVRMKIDMIGKHITEIFTTTISSNKVKEETDIPNVFPYKVDQLMGYCHSCGETCGDLLVFHLFGDYSRFTETPLGLQYTGIEPELKSWTFFFEESELIDLWDRVLNRKAILEHAVKVKEVPKEKGEQWECMNCAFAYKCPDAVIVDGVDVEKAKDTLRRLEGVVERLREEGVLK